MQAPPTEARAGHAALPPLLPWVGIALGAALAAVLGFGLGSPFSLALWVLSGLGLATVLMLHAPGLAVASLPFLLLPPQFAKVFPYEVALILVAGALLLAGLRSRSQWVYRLDPVEAATAALLVWAMATAFWCRDLWWYTFGVRKMGVGVLALWTAWRLGRWVGAERLRAGIAGGACALAAFTLVKAATSGGTAWGQELARREMTNLGWGTSNFIGALLVLMLPTALHLAMHAASRSARLLGYITLPLVVMVMAAAASRGGALLVASVALLVLFRKRIGPRTLAVLAGLALSVGLLLAGPWGRPLLERFTSPRDLGSMVIRLMYFQQGWRRLLEHMPWGMGLGQGYGYPDKLSTVDPHNYWLVVGPELGLPGIALWLTVLALLWRRMRLMARDPVTREVGRTLQLTFLISQVNCLYEPTFQGLQYHFLFYWIFGAYLGSTAPAARASAPRTIPRNSSARMKPEMA